MKQIHNTGKGVAQDGYSELIVHIDGDTVWVMMNPSSRQCMTVGMLTELLNLLNGLDKSNISFLVLASAHDEIFNSGGDLQYFTELISLQNKELLIDYARLCTDLIYWGMTGGKRNITTIACVAGDALGGGFEAALACKYLVAERQAVFSLPEVRFGLFPGMGGLALFAMRAGIKEADIAFSTGKVYTSRELYDLGLVCAISETGNSLDEVRHFIKKRQLNSAANNALQKLRSRMQSIQYKDLIYNMDIWVEHVLQMTTKDLRRMKYLISKQHERVGE